MLQKKRRVRGIILSRQGWQKVQDAKLEWEYQKNQGYKITLEEIGEKAGLTTATIRKILTRDEGVDRRSIVALFSALDLDLNPEDYTKPEPQNKLQTNKAQSKVDWGEATDISVFYGRVIELSTLERWCFEARCRLILIVGMGGLGKTSLSVKFAHQVENRFERVVWRSLRDAPPIQELLTNLIQFLSEQPIAKSDLPESVSEKISRLINCLRSSPCLVILDNIESLLCDESRAGICSAEYQEYGELFRRLGESEHQSCVLLTSREKPKEVTSLEGEYNPVRSLQLEGFSEQEGKKILQQKGINSTEEELVELVKHYDGNPLALKIAGTTIRDLFQGDVNEFLRQDTAIFGDINDVLDQQFQRLLKIEQNIMYWLAINREPMELEQINEDLVDSVTKFKLLDGLDSLSKRCLIEKVESATTDKGRVRFTLQSVVMEYITNRLIENVCQEINTQNIQLFRYYALVKATAKDYIKEIQINLIIKPIITRLLDVLGGQSNIEQRLNQIKTTIQQTSPLQPGYVAGNILNLLRYMGTDLKGADFSNLCIWQADLQNVCLHDVSFQKANFNKTIFCETFGGIISVAFSHDGKVLAAGDSNGDIHLWRVSDNQSLDIFRGHTSWVTSLNFSPDDTLLASGSSDSDVKLWDVKTGQCLQTIKEHQGEVWSVIFSLDSQTLVSGSDDHTIRYWQPSTGECLKVIQEHTSWVTSLAFNTDGNILVSGSDDRTIRLWNFKTGECLRVLSGHSDGVRSLAFSPDNQILVSGSDDHTVKLWDVDTGECFNTLHGHTNQIFSVAFSPKGNIVASGCNDQTVKLWNIDTGECFITFQDHSNWVVDIAFNPGGDILASGSRDQTLKLWDMSKKQCIKTNLGYSHQVLSVCFSPNDKILASGSQDRTIRLWNIDTGECSKILQGHLNWVHSVTFNSQGDRLISGSGDKTIKIWDVNTGECLKTLTGHNAIVKSVACSPNGKILASGSEDNTVRLWDVETGQVIKILAEHQAAVWSIAFSPDGKNLASGSFDQTIKIWNIDTGECLKTLTGHETWIWSVAFSPDGKTLASSSPDGTLRFWNFHTGECTKIINPSTGWLLSTAFSNNGQMFAASSQDCTVKVWNTNNYELIKTFFGHKSGFLWSVTFGTNSNLMASGGDDEIIKIWNIETGECLNSLTAESLYEGMNIRGVSGLSESIKLNLKLLGVVTNSP